VSPDAQKMFSDPDMLKRIMTNLISNAIQAMPNGGKVNVQSCEDAGDIIIAVEDTGCGIPDEVKTKLFTPLFITKSKGQGLGLAVIKRMTEALGGTVSFESETGKGTKLIVRLPLKTKQ
jgi:signal transduction histidine kinase